MPQPSQPDIGREAGGAFCRQLPAHCGSHVAAEQRFAHGWAQVQPSAVWALQQAPLPCCEQPSQAPAQLICAGAAVLST